MQNIASLPNAAARARLDWSAQVGPSSSKPVVGQDEVWVGSYQGDSTELQRFDAGSGAKLPSVPLSRGTLEGSFEGNAVLRGSDDNVMGFDPKTGVCNWQIEAASPRVISLGGPHIVVANKSGLTGVRPGGQPEEAPFSSPLPETQSLTPTPDGGWLVHTGQYRGSGQLHSLASNGDVRWSARVDSGGPQHHPVAAADGTAFSTGFGGSVSAFDGETGEKRWEYRTDQPYTNPPSIGPDGSAIVSTAMGDVTQLDADGRVRWRRESGGSVEATFVHPDGTVFVKQREGLLALDGGTGEELQKMALSPGQVTQGPDGNLYQLSYPGTLQRIVLE